MMESIYQNDEYGCGIACIAMLCGISYDAAKLTCGDAYTPGYGIETEPLIKIIGNSLALLGKGRITQSKPVTSLPSNALLLGHLLPSRGKIDRSDDGNVYKHWLVWDATVRAVGDPYKFRKPIWLTHYWIVR
jgi:hypothetical protein